MLTVTPIITTKKINKKYTEKRNEEIIKVYIKQHKKEEIGGTEEHKKYNIYRKTKSKWQKKALHYQ